MSLKISSSCSMHVYSRDPLFNASMCIPMRLKIHLRFTVMYLIELAFYRIILLAHFYFKYDANELGIINILSF